MEACFCAVEEGIVLPDGECIGLAAKCIGLVVQCTVPAA